MHSEVDLEALSVRMKRAQEVAVELGVKNAAGREENQSLGARLKVALQDLEQARGELRGRDEIIGAQAEEIAELNRRVGEERSRVEAILASSADGILVVDSNQIITHVNGALESLCGYAADEIVGRPCSHLLDARDSSGQCLCDFACPHLGSDVMCGRVADTTIANKEGARVWVRIATSVIGDGDGNGVRGVVHNLRDMTKYDEAERMKDEFISVASHELMTPLTALKGFAQLAQRIGAKSGEDGSLMRSLHVLNEEADRLVDLVTRLVDEARLKAKRGAVRKTNFELNDLAEQVVARLRATTSQHVLRVVSEERMYVNADCDQIDQVLTNLVGNAVKYSPLGGEIELRVEAMEGHIRVSVSDRGIGIPLEKQGRIFDRFYQAHSGPRGYSRGMGLGLHICREIISSHGGQIWVRSEENRGSTFYFALPTGIAD